MEVRLKRKRSVLSVLYCYKVLFTHSSKYDSQEVLNILFFFACDEPGCPYYSITIFARVGCTTAGGWWEQSTPFTNLTFSSSLRCSRSTNFCDFSAVFSWEPSCWSIPCIHLGRPFFLWSSWRRQIDSTSTHLSVQRLTNKYNELDAFLNCQKTNTMSYA